LMRWIIVGRCRGSLSFELEVQDLSEIGRLPGTELIVVDGAD